jgi:hypothetical protein
MNRLYAMLGRICTTEAVSQDVLQTTAVVGRLYAMQLEEIDHDRET